MTLRKCLLNVTLVINGLATGRRNIEVLDIPTEYEEVDSKPYNADGNNKPPLSAGTLHNAKDDPVNDAAVCIPDRHAHKVHDHERQAGHHRMEHVKRQSNEQKEELGRLGDTRDNGDGSRRDQ